MTFSRYFVWQQQRRVINLLVMDVIYTATGCMTASECSPFMISGDSRLADPCDESMPALMQTEWSPCCRIHLLEIS